MGLDRLSNDTIPDRSLFLGSLSTHEFAAWLI